MFKQLLHVVASKRCIDAAVSNGICICLFTVEYAVMALFDPINTVACVDVFCSTSVV